MHITTSQMSGADAHVFFNPLDTATSMLLDL